MNNKFYQVSVVCAENGLIFDVQPAANVDAYFEAGLVRELMYNLLSVKLPWNVPGYREFLVWAEDPYRAAEAVMRWYKMV